MTSNEIRKQFTEFYESKNHKIVSSAPMVVKNDPTLMFTNAGMNQFKDIFLGNKDLGDSRVANTQKCLRVSGKHNDLEEVGHDTYHHTMFEMLGNWSFGDYFKKEAIDWAWELLTKIYGIDQERLYASVFEGSPEENTARDEEAYNLWLKYLPAERIINGNKKDNFWEMGDTGPCGPCSEIHIDIRSDEERQKVDALELINKDHPLVIEIWNLVFIQYNRRANSTLEQLPAQHVDTGMGLERLCMVVQGKKSNYDTDVFQPIIQKLAKLSAKTYGQSEETDIAMRVIADHLRAVAFSIADGQLPSNAKAGYVIRRILRRAVRYGYTFLGHEEPIIYKLVSALIENMGNAFAELKSQQDIIAKVIKEEENSFLRTLATGIKLLEQLMEKARKASKKTITGNDAFVLYDTFGFPFDLTNLILRENNLSVSEEDFRTEMDKQKNRSRQDAKVETDDWIILQQDDIEEFIGYEYTQTQVEITKYRKIVRKKKELFQLVFNLTPFYGESGGQVGDKGYIEANGEKIKIIDTQKENDLIVHITEKLPTNLSAEFEAFVNQQSRNLTECNHSATHLLHSALRTVLGNHVEQKGSFVDEKRLRFDFSHFQKVTDDEIIKIEQLVNDDIRKNIPLKEHRGIPMSHAKRLGALALFGEKYGDLVRVISFDNSIELCGGTHVDTTGKIGFFKITVESSIASGIRRIEAITAKAAENFIAKEISTLTQIRSMFKNPKDVSKAVSTLFDEKEQLQKQIDAIVREKTNLLRENLLKNIENVNGINIIAKKIEADSAQAVKDLAFQLKTKVSNLVLIIGAEIKGKPNLTVMVSENLVEERKLHAGQVVRQAAKAINGGGGGQPFYATAGGKNINGIETAISQARELLVNN